MSPEKEQFSIFENMLIQSFAELDYILELMSFWSLKLINKQFTYLLKKTNNN